MHLSQHLPILQVKDVSFAVQGTETFRPVRMGGCSVEIPEGTNSRGTATQTARAGGTSKPSQQDASTSPCIISGHPGEETKTSE